MLIPFMPLADFHCSRMAQPSETRVISFVPTCLPVWGFFTFHLPNQKSNCRNSGAVQLGDGAGDWACSDETLKTAAVKKANFMGLSLVGVDPKAKKCGRSESRLFRPRGVG